MAAGRDQITESRGPAMMEDQITEIAKLPAAGAVEHAMAKLRGMSADELREVIGRSMQLTVDSLVTMAAAVRLLEEQGAEIDLPGPAIGQLRRIAYGQILPSLVARYNQVPLLLNKIAALPLPDQLALSEREAVEVAFLRDGRIDRRNVPLSSLSRDEMHQVFTRDGIRNEIEQVSYIKSREASMATSPRRGRSVFTAETSDDSGDPFRAAINEAITRKGWSVAEFARQAGLGYQSINSYLAGRSSIRSDALAKMAKAANVKVVIG